MGSTSDERNCSLGQNTARHHCLTKQYGDSAAKVMTWRPLRDANELWRCYRQRSHGAQFCRKLGLQVIEPPASFRWRDLRCSRVRVERLPGRFGTDVTDRAGGRVDKEQRPPIHSPEGEVGDGPSSACRPVAMQWLAEARI